MLVQMFLIGVEHGIHMVHILLIPLGLRSHQQICRLQIPFQLSCGRSDHPICPNFRGDIMFPSFLINAESLWCSLDEARISLENVVWLWRIVLVPLSSKCFTGYSIIEFVSMQLRCSHPEIIIKIK